MSIVRIAGIAVLVLSATACPSPPPPVATPVQLDVGENWSCVTMTDATARCWGFNGGDLIDHTPGSPQFNVTPKRRELLFDVTSVAAGGMHGPGCATHSDLTTSCWAGGWGELITPPSGINYRIPAAVVGLADVEEVTSGHYHTCARLTDGRVKCHGANYAGQLGTGTTTPGLPPTAGPADVIGITDAVAVDAGDGVSCAVLAGGTVECWGGFFGEEPTPYSTIPVEIPGLTNVTGVEVAITPFAFQDAALACAIAGGAVKCWMGLVNGVVPGGESLTGVTDIAVGARTVCAVEADATVSCWGDGERGMLGNGSYVDAPTPVTVTGLADVVSVSGGSTHMCALTESAEVWCWGGGNYGQLGNGGTADSAVPVRVVQLA